MTAACLTADDRLRVVVDVRTSETVFGPATRAQTAAWIIRDGFWRGADLRVDVIEPACMCTDMACPDPVHQEPAGDEPEGDDDGRDYAEEAYNRDFCDACGSSPCTWDGVPDGFHTVIDLTEGAS
jgi:hypothetical protein